MTFHPRRLAFESGLYHAGRSLPVMAGGILLFVGGLLTTIALVAWFREGSRDKVVFLAIVLGASVSLLLGGAAVAARGLRQVAEARRLARDGKRADGTVLAVRGSRMTVDNRTQLIVRYRYRDQAGGAHEGDSWPLSPDEGWSEGDTGVVRYDPAHPATSLWIGRER